MNISTGMIVEGGQYLICTMQETLVSYDLCFIELLYCSYHYFELYNKGEANFYFWSEFCENKVEKNSKLRSFNANLPRSKKSVLLVVCR